MKAVGSKGQGGYVADDIVASHVGNEFRADLGQIRWYVAHRNRGLNRGPETPAAYNSNGVGFAGRAEGGVVPNRSATFRLQTNSDAARSGLPFMEDPFGTGKVGLFTTSLRNRPFEISFYWRDGFVEIVTVEAKARLETKGVASAETGGFDSRVC